MALSEDKGSYLVAADVPERGNELWLLTSAKSAVTQWTLIGLSLGGGNPPHFLEMLP